MRKWIPGNSSGENVFSMVGWNPAGFKGRDTDRCLKNGAKTVPRGFDRKIKRLGRLFRRIERDYQLDDTN